MMVHCREEMTEYDIDPQVERRLRSFIHRRTHLDSLRDKEDNMIGSKFSAQMGLRSNGYIIVAFVVPWVWTVGSSVAVTRQSKYRYAFILAISSCTTAGSEAGPPIDDTFVKMLRIWSVSRQIFGFENGITTSRKT